MYVRIKRQTTTAFLTVNLTDTVAEVKARIQELLQQVSRVCRVSCVCRDVRALSLWRKGSKRHQAYPLGWQCLPRLIGCRASVVSQVSVPHATAAAADIHTHTHTRARARTHAHTHAHTHTQPPPQHTRNPTAQPAESQRLLKDGTPLDDARTLADYGVDNDDVLTLSLRRPGACACVRVCVCACALRVCVRARLAAAWRARPS